MIQGKKKAETIRLSISKPQRDPDTGHLWECSQEKEFTSQRDLINCVPTEEY